MDSFFYIKCVNGTQFIRHRYRGESSPHIGEQRTQLLLRWTLPNSNKNLLLVPVITRAYNGGKEVEVEYNLVYMSWSASNCNDDSLPVS